MTENIYDINDYNDEDLLKILDLSNPTDRELEAKIIIMIRKYEGTDRKMARFFNEMYEHFFDTQTRAKAKKAKNTKVTKMRLRVSQGKKNQ